MLIRYAEIYENTDILSPIDRETWDFIGETCRLSNSSRIIELASGKGAFAFHLAQRFRCRIDCFDGDSEFVEYSQERARILGLDYFAKFTLCDINQLAVDAATYGVGVCFGAMYLFREAGWRVFSTGVKPSGYLVISDLFCKKIPPPKELIEVFFEEEEGGPETLAEVRGKYKEHGLTILREEECSQKAWLDYYDSTRKMILSLSKKYKGDAERQREIVEALREDALYRKYGQEYIGYMTFIMQKP